MNLNLTSLYKSINSLDKAINVYKKESIANDNGSDLMQTLRAGVIQNFEFTYELCWKFMKRWLDENIGPTVADGVTRRELFRLSAENKLITDVDKWMEFHRSRNLTSHTYDEETANEVLVYAIKFLNSAKEFLKNLEARNE
jgi:nucleotidyltransferase substrate binding protein (TIGR01987 family)